MAVDTSVVALGVLVDLDVERMGRAFESVLIADELAADARMAVESAKRSVSGFVAYDPGLGRVIAQELDERQQAETQRKAERVLRVLQAWQSVRSGPLPLLENTEKDVCRPWDASLRVALSHGCPLWCDDLALRGLAESQGIATFSTWALYETLTGSDGGDRLPASTDMKMRLLRAKIADVPISWQEIDHAVEDSDEPDPAVNLFLRRPVIWDSNLQETLAWYLKRFRMLIEGPLRQRAPELLHAACHGLAATGGFTTPQPVVGRILAGSLFLADDPTMTPALLAAARYASGELEPVDRPDPLPESVKQLLEFLEEASLEPAQAARIVTELFSQTEPADRQTATLTVLADR